MLEALRRYIDKNGSIGVVLVSVGVLYFVNLLVEAFAGPIAYAAIWTKMTLPFDITQFIWQPWSLFTYWFMTPSKLLFLVLFNLLFFYQFAMVFRHFMGEDKTRRLIFFAILINAIGVMLLGVAFSGYSPETYSVTRIYGLTNLVITFVAAAITIAPNYPVNIFFVFRTRLVYLGAGIILLTLLTYRGMFAAEGVSVMVSALVGFGYIRLLRSGTDITAWMIPKADRQSTSGARTTLVRVQSRNQAGRPKKEERLDPEEELNRLLDRINEVGYEKLTRKEKERLEELSNR